MLNITVLSDENSEFTLFRLTLTVCAYEGKSILCNFKFNGFFLIGLKLDLLKASKLLNGTDNGAEKVLNIHLDNFLSLVFTRISYLDGCYDLSVGLYHIAAYFSVGIFKACVAESVAEGIKGLIGAIYVRGLEKLTLGVIRTVISRFEVIVIYGTLSYIMREGHCKLSTGYAIAE